MAGGKPISTKEGAPFLTRSSGARRQVFVGGAWGSQGWESKNQSDRRIRFGPFIERIRSDSGHPCSHVSIEKHKVSAPVEFSLCKPRATRLRRGIETPAFDAKVDFHGDHHGPMCFRR